MSEEDNKTEEAQEQGSAPEATEGNLGEEDMNKDINEEIPQKGQDSPTKEGSVSLKDEGRLGPDDGGGRSTNVDKGAASGRAENEFILVEDVDSAEPRASGSIEGDAGHEECADEDDMLEHGEDDEEEEYEEGDVSAEQRDIHDVVNEVLDTKLESFQAQIQKMFTMMQGSVDEPAGKGATAGGTEELDESVCEDDDDFPAQSGDKDDAKGPEEQQQSHQQKEWKEFLGRVSTILDLEATSVKSVLDETVGSAEKVAEYLPAEGIVKNSWGRVKGKLLKEVTQHCNKFTLQDYNWPAEDMEAYGNVTYTNADLIEYLRYVGGNTKQIHGLERLAKRLHSDLRGIEGLFRYQQRIISYASYFTAALGKLLGAEQVSGKDKIEEMLKNLGQCLIDACDTSVNGCVLTTRSSRRLYVDALQISESKNPTYNIMNLPVSKKLFPPTELKNVLLNFGINLEKPHLSRGGFTGRGSRGSFGQLGGLTRGSRRGFSPRGRGTYIRGRPSPVRGVMRGRGGPPSREREGRDRSPPRDSSRDSSRGRGMPPRGRGAYPRGRGARGRGWQPQNRGRGRGRPDRGIKRGPHDDSPIAEKHRRVEPIQTVGGSYSSHYDRGASPQRRQSFSPRKRDRGVDYQSVPDDPSSYYRSPSERELSPRRSYNNKGWY